MKYLSYIHFQSDFYPFSNGEILTFKDGVNLIVGNQGCGKSTLLKIIIERYNNIQYGDVKQYENYMFFDTEKHNPRILKIEEVNKFYEFAVTENVENDDIFLQKMNFLRLKYLNDKGNKNEFLEKSHGEIIFPMIEQLQDCENALILIDEPESSLSIKNQYKLIKIFDQLIIKNCQLFVATHSLILIEYFKNVLNLENRVWQTTDEFLREHLE